MADTFNIEIATPERLLSREKAISAQIPAKEGYIGMLPGHAALLSELGIGALTFVTADNLSHSFAIRGGYLEILNDNVRVLTDQAEKSTEIDAARAEQELNKAQQEMLNPALGMDIAAALIAYRHAQARVDATKAAPR